MRKVLLIFLVLIILSFYEIWASESKYLSGNVTFLHAQPVIDGILDEDLNHLLKREFIYTEKSSKNNPVVKIHYRLGYGTKFFYIYIEVEQGKLNVRDRGYQNGDGFHLALTLPKPGNEPTDEFYILGFTPTRKSDMQWQRKFVWYRNVDGLLSPLKKTMFEEKVKEGKTGYEVLIPWREIYPYHPWISPSIGFNMCYVQAVGEVDYNFYFVLKDDRIQAEQSLRRYLKLIFEKPELKKGKQVYAILSKNHFFQEHSPELIITSVSAKKDYLKGQIQLNSKERKRAYKQEYRIKMKHGLAVNSVKLNTSSLVSGNYTLKWTESGDSDILMTVIPRFDFSKLKNVLPKIKSNITPGNHSTLQFRLEFIHNQLKKLKPYDLADDLNTKIVHVVKAISAAKQGNDLISDERKTGIFRRAYRSRLDDTLQPYTISLPQEYSDDKKYPLMVWLHGSAMDDRHLPRLLIPILRGFIILAPYGRGTSNAYCKDNSQTDIKESIEDVLINFPVDQSNIFLAGLGVLIYLGTKAWFFIMMGKKTSVPLPLLSLTTARS